MENVKVTESELKMIKNSRHYSVILKLNHNSLNAVINNPYDNYECQFLTLILANGKIKGDEIKSKLSLKQIFSCFGMLNGSDDSKRNVIGNILSHLNGAVICPKLLKYANAHHFHNTARSL